MVNLKRVEASRWPEVHALMVARGFPGVPLRYEMALPLLALVRLYALGGPDGLRVVFVVGPDDDGVAFLDVVCVADAEGRWATKPVMRALAHELFETLKLRCVWVEAHHKKALKAALTAGFVPATELDADKPVLVMTRMAALKYITKGECDDGKFVQCAEDSGAAGTAAAKHGA